MIYILHFAPAFKGVQHYVGWCQEDRLTARLREHAQGRGAALVRAVIRHGSSVYLARSIPEGTPLLERQIKDKRQAKRLCPFCCEVLAHMRKDAYALDTSRPMQPPVRDVFGWPTTPPPRPHPRK